MIMKDPMWNEIEKLCLQLIEQQQKHLLAWGRKIIPHLTADDLLQPNDFLVLENQPNFRYEEGLLAGLKTMQTALNALRVSTQSISEE